MSALRDTSPKIYGSVGEFGTPEELLLAATAARAVGYNDIEGYSPIAVHGLSEVVGKVQDWKLSWSIFIAGVVGACAGFALQVWVSSIAYMHWVGGKPIFSWPAFIPVTFECTVLFAGLTAAGAMFALNGLPKPHHPMFNASAMHRASQDRFILSIEATDPTYDPASAEAFLTDQGAISVETVMTSEGY